MELINLTKEEVLKISNTSGVFKVYKILCPITNNIMYVGMTQKKLKRRLQYHINWGKPITTAGEWCNDMVKDGKMPQIELIEYCSSIEEGYELETKYITKYKKEGILLLNKTFGKGSLGVPSGMLGKKQSPQNKERFRILSTGRVPSKETIKKISDALIGKKRSVSSCKKQSVTMMGHSCSDERRKKMSLNSAFKTKIVQLDLNYNLIKEWDSIMEAAIGLNINYSTIRRLVQSKLKATSKNTKFKFTYLSHYNSIKKCTQTYFQKSLF